MKAVGVLLILFGVGGIWQVTQLLDPEEIGDWLAWLLAAIFIFIGLAMVSA